jgi:NADH-quinone oxidoreductase subunit L
VAIAGVPGLAGFFSKDEILFRSYPGGYHLLWMVGLLTSFLTAIYMFRLVFLTFHGERAEPAHADAGHTGHVEAHGADDHGAHPGTHGHGGRHPYDAPPAMAFALIVLALGSVLAGYVGFPRALGGSNPLERFLEPSFTAGETAGIERAAPPAGGEQTEEASADLERGLMGVSSVVAVAGIAVAWFFFVKKRSAADELAARFAGLHTLLANKYYVDEVYSAAVVEPIRIVSQEGLWKGVDVRIIDGMVNGAGHLVGWSSRLLRRVQSGSVRVYAGSVFLGVVAVLGYFLWR